MEQAIVVKETDALNMPMAIDEVVGQVHLIQDVMRKVMREEEHYGIIPGTGNKPSLLKPGAEKLSMTFKLAPQYEIKAVDMENEHREYEVICNLTAVQTGVFLGSGVGNCNTKESKYRYRSENTGRAVPKEYWENRDTALLGGKQFRAKKKDKKWIICEQVEYDNPADYYNTIKKMAKKRAFVDAVLTVTAASDIFTQDVEDLPGINKEDTKKTNGTPSPTDQVDQTDQTNRLIKLINSDETVDELIKRYKNNAALIKSLSTEFNDKVMAAFTARKKAVLKKEAIPPANQLDLAGEQPSPQKEEKSPPPIEWIPPSTGEDLPPIFGSEPTEANPTLREKAIIDSKAFLDGAAKEQLPDFMNSLKAQLNKMPLEDQSEIRAYYDKLVNK